MERGRGAPVYDVHTSYKHRQQQLSSFLCAKGNPVFPIEREHHIYLTQKGPVFHSGMAGEKERESEGANSIVWKETFRRRRP